MRLDPNDPVVSAATFGKQVEQFLRSDIGAYIIRIAKDQSDAATEKLKMADPYNAVAIANLQHEIKVAESVAGWLADAVRAGLQALEQLEEE